MNGALPFLKVQADGVSLQLKVVPRASRNELGTVLGDRLKVRIAAPPVDSAANLELIAFLAGLFGVPRGAVHLIQGQASRTKTVFLQGVTPGQVAALVGSPS